MPAPYNLRHGPPVAKNVVRDDVTCEGHGPQHAEEPRRNPQTDTCPVLNDAYESSREYRLMLLTDWQSAVSKSEYSQLPRVDAKSGPDVHELAGLLCSASLVIKEVLERVVA